MALLFEDDSDKRNEGRLNLAWSLAESLQSEVQSADQIERTHRRGFPRPVLNIFFTALAYVLVERRPEERLQILLERSAIYKRVAELLEALIVDAGDSIPTAAERVWDILQSCMATDNVVTE